MKFPTPGFFQRCFPSPLHQQFQLLRVDVNRLGRRFHGYLCFDQQLAEAPVQRVAEYFLNGPVRLVREIILAAPCRTPQ